MPSTKKPKRPTCVACAGLGQTDRTSFVNPKKTVRSECSLCKGEGVVPIRVDLYDVLEALHELGTGASLAMATFIEKRFGNTERSFRSMEEVDAALFPNIEKDAKPRRIRPRKAQ